MPTSVERASFSSTRRTLLSTGTSDSILFCYFPSYFIWSFDLIRSDLTVPRVFSGAVGLTVAGPDLTDERLIDALILNTCHPAEDISAAALIWLRRIAVKLNGTHLQVAVSQLTFSGYDLIYKRDKKLSFATKQLFTDSLQSGRRLAAAEFLASVHGNSLFFLSFISMGSNSPHSC